jgi:hypothetical protein
LRSHSADLWSDERGEDEPMRRKRNEIDFACVVVDREIKA